MLLLAVSGAMADLPAERGAYLVNTIMACGNCHTPRDADGKAIAEKAFSGGLTFTTPGFIATAPNITPDRDTGIGSWSDQDIKRALVEGIRPEHGRFAGVPLAAIMPANFYKALLAEHPEVRDSNPKQTLYYAVEAAELGEPGAMAALIDLKWSKNPQFQDRPGACKLIETAANSGDQVSAQRLTECRAN